MRKILIALVLLSSVSGFATDLKCKVYPTEADVPRELRMKGFVLTNIESEKNLNASFDDQSTMDAFKGDRGELTSASFSNECDNMYDVSFIMEDFKKILSRQSKEITGYLEYGNAGVEESQHVLIKCFIK